jgi:hypothetical protein
MQMRSLEACLVGLGSTLFMFGWFRKEGFEMIGGAALLVAALIVEVMI